MPRDPFYRTPAWRALRAARLRIDRHTCTAPGCNKRATVVDHIRSRRNGGADDLTNLRSLCDGHDKAVKELSNGKRRNGGLFKDVGANGVPLDQNHPWYGGRSVIGALGATDRYRGRIRSKFQGQ